MGLRFENRGGSEKLRPVNTSARRKPAKSVSPTIVTSRQISPTEQRNPRSMKLDRLPIKKAVELMLSEDRKVPQALLRETGPISRAVDLIVKSFRRGGKLFYVGAGTSG